MNTNLRKPRTGVLLTTLFGALIAATVSAEDIRIVVPYLGLVENVYEYEYEGNTIKLDDTGLMGGLYAQWINPDLYQWNAFVYHSPDINHSTLWGTHFIFDYYFGSRTEGQWVLGAGIDIIRLDMDAGDELKDEYLYDFVLENTIVVPYARAGKYFRFDANPVEVTILPWAGVQPQWVLGNVNFTVDPPGPFPPPIAVDEDFDDYDLFALAGLNLRLTLFRFVEVDAKYMATFNAEDFLSSWSNTANLYITRNLGVSYRFKWFENTQGATTYHLFGVAFVF